jgi:nucleotide-binding universal stress UspA family protein
MDDDGRTPRYDEVIVPLDLSTRAEAALPIARSLASLFAARLHLVHVTWSRDPADVEAYLDSVATSLVFERVVTSVVRGWPVPEITGLVDGDTNALLCLAAHARTGAGAVLLGSVADELLRSIAAPLVVVGPDVDPELTPPDTAGGTILVCFDGSDVSATIEPVALDWARRLGARMQIVMVLHRDGTFLGNEDATRPKARAHELAERMSAAGIDTELQLLDGLDPARAVGAHAASLGARFVLTASHGAGGVVRSALGSIALRIVRHSPCPVMIRRPPEPPG